MSEQGSIRTVGDLRLDARSGLVTTTRPDGSLKRAVLTPLETRVLAYLMAHAGIPQPDHRILNQVWGATSPHTARHTVRQHIRHIRLKIEPDPSKPMYLVTRIRYGYMIAAPVDNL